MIDPAMLVKCQDAVPALRMVYEALRQNNVIVSTSAEEQRQIVTQAADALWHWPELVQAAVQYHEATKPTTGFHSAEIR